MTQLDGIRCEAMVLDLLSKDLVALQTVFSKLKLYHYPNGNPIIRKFESVVAAVVGRRRRWWEEAAVVAAIQCAFTTRRKSNCGFTGYAAGLYVSDLSRLQGNVAWRTTTKRGCSSLSRRCGNDARHCRRCHDKC